MNDVFLYDWSANNGLKKCYILDDTLRDGLQSVNLVSPNIDEKILLINYMINAGIDVITLSYPAMSKITEQESLIMLKHFTSVRAKVLPDFAARTLIKDIQPIVNLQEKTGIKVQAHLFIGCSALRQHIEKWNIEFIRDRIRESLYFAQQQNLQAVLVIEDGTRTDPTMLSEIVETAILYGAKGICIADTTGYADCAATKKIIEFTKHIVNNNEIHLEWHGHNDRGLALANALTAIAEGIEVIHATSLGLGERTGNVPFEVLMANLFLYGCLDIDMKSVYEYAKATRKFTKALIAPNHPVVGDNVFTTATGTHAAAMYKAAQTDCGLVDYVYSSIPAHVLGRKQQFEIGRMSGIASIVGKLIEMGLPQNHTIINEILEKAKKSNAILTQNELDTIIKYIETNNI